MPAPSASEVTQLLLAWSAGDQSAAEERAAQERLNTYETPAGESPHNAAILIDDRKNFALTKQDWAS